MKRLSTISIVFILAIEAVVFGYVTTTNAAPPPTTTPQNPPDTIACFVGDTLFVLPKWTPSTTPTRIPTPTPLLEVSPTRMVTLTPSATATPACKAGTVTATSLNVRAEANALSKVLRTEKQGAVLRLKTTVGAWYSLCDGGWVSAAWVKVGN